MRSLLIGDIVGCIFYMVATIMHLLGARNASDEPSPRMNFMVPL